ncbi:hypothetical protein CLOLEP_03933 [[Clostridium] leptum DSM 753]|uniref:Uncharacterized protein n=1 Tax=[Clostridium] leptum DSM 753 TaxID=428125 RepID=A7VZA4_9FIRM|nr:hypothetical protein CLOLEP_03933 [[Clostridium] leptum DSM 753]
MKISAAGSRKFQNRRADPSRDFTLERPSKACFIRCSRKSPSAGLTGSPNEPHG